MRGALVSSNLAPIISRIIPADAGSTWACSRDHRPYGDHPRGCGEHSARDFRNMVNTGSSPRMRGALPRMPATPVSPRIIPADAGSTGIMSDKKQVYQDHPRGCGEHHHVDSGAISGSGSSPRMRGALGPGLRVPVPPGIIPADAGSTSTKIPPGRCGRDHPRGCGEHPSTLRPWAMSGGSSPRMRGARRLLRGHHAGPGIIPADAGSTWACSRDY